MGEILKLFDANIDTHSLHLFSDVCKNNLKAEDILEKKNDTQDLEAEALEIANHKTLEKEQPLDTEYIECDILYEKCKLICIPVKACKDDFWPEKNVFRNPFILLEDSELIHRTVQLIEPYILDYQESYSRLLNNEVSPFTRDQLKGAYILHHEDVEFQALIKHNNYVLSTLFQNKLPGNNVLWHMIFLYVMATKRFPEHCERFFKEIRYLGEHASYFVTLTPHLNPPIVESLNCCFWYIACVCPKAYPNSKKNVLRTRDFYSGTILEFYRLVYDKQYAAPELMPRWKLWRTLCEDRSCIFPILSYYFEHDTVQGLETAFSTILYRKKANESSLPPGLEFLNNLTLKEVLNIYKKLVRSNHPNIWENMDQIGILDHTILYDKSDERVEDLLCHVEINVLSCHPLVYCQSSKKHWKECIGPYSIEKRSYLRLFKRFCIQYDRYPENSDELMCFLNKRVFMSKDQIPEVFPFCLKDQMNKVLKIFEKIMELYECKEYIEISNLNAAESKREALDKIYLITQNTDFHRKYSAKLKQWRLLEKSKENNVQEMIDSICLKIEEFHMDRFVI